MESLILVLIITQIIVESLPISSSGHVALVGMMANKFLGIQNTILPDFLDNLLHGTALLAILIVFFKDWFYPIKKLIQACTQFLFKLKPLSFSQKRLFAIFTKIVGLVIVADLITSVFYFFIKVIFEKTIFVDTFGNINPNFLILGFIITMLLLLSLKFHKPYGTKPNDSEPNLSETNLNFKKAAILGTVQGLALLPGISRFASTYVAACWLNISPRRAFQISFLIHLPLIVAVFLFLGIKDILTKPKVLQSLNTNLNTTNFFIILAATICAVLTLNLCYKLAVKNKLWWLGIYMLIPIITLIYLLY